LKEPEAEGRRESFEGLHHPGSNREKKRIVDRNGHPNENQKQKGLFNSITSWG